MKTQRFTLNGPVEIALPDGTILRAQPGPYGKGISLVQLYAQPTAKKASEADGRGRPPNASTQQLREMLRKDAAGAGLRGARFYIDWLAKRETKSKVSSLQQTVYRELRAVRGGKKTGAQKGKVAARGQGKRGRQPHPATVALREKLAKDAPDLKEALHYIRWLVDEAGIGLRQARPIVYREMRSAR